MRTTLVYLRDGLISPTKRDTRTQAAHTELFRLMNICPYCQRTVPGVETICKDCYERVYANGSVTKPTLLQLIKNWHSKQIPDREPTETVRVPQVAWLLALGLGVVLYSVISFAGPVIAGLVLIAGNAIIAYDIFDSSVRRSRNSTLFSTVILLSLAFYVIARMTGNQTYLNIASTGACVTAAYILIDHRRVI